ncbi:MAG: hypothetical protein MRY23_02060 [Pelagibacteraceae bacterium]|nr:hypothetical protein [Pelagibacteraceae bacterium]MCI5079627.1 hypothetical protein [Pelagibacteraceae bacterium]
MTTKKIKANIFLLIVLLTIILFYGYYINENKGSININKSQTQNLEPTTVLKEGVTKFFEVEYKIIDNENQVYITQSKEAFLYKDQPDIIDLKNVYSFTKLKDGSVLDVKSNKAKYFKNLKNINYHGNVIITNKEATITAQKANFLSKKNKITLEDNVLYKDKKNTVIADFAELNTLNNNLEIFMSKKRDRVYGKRQK